jgi:hypothetical protein
MHAKELWPQAAIYRVLPEPAAGGMARGRRARPARFVLIDGLAPKWEAPSCDYSSHDQALGGAVLKVQPALEH